MATFNKNSNLFYFVTSSREKFNELEAIWNTVLTPTQLKTYGPLQHKDLDLEEIQEIDPIKVIEAKLTKAHERFPNAHILIEDTSLYMQALKNNEDALPGPLIKWFMKTVGNEGIVKIAKCFNNSNATAKCIIGIVDENGKKHYFEGSVDGNIVKYRSANRGFGWDPVFEPNGQEATPRTFAEMSSTQKTKYSMRGKAARKLVEYIAKSNLTSKL